MPIIFSSRKNPKLLHTSEVGTQRADQYTWYTRYTQHSRYTLGTAGTLGTAVTLYTRGAAGTLGTIVTRNRSSRIQALS